MPPSHDGGKRPSTVCTVQIFGRVRRLFGALANKIDSSSLLLLCLSLVFPSSSQPVARSRRHRRCRRQSLALRTLCSVGRRTLTHSVLLAVRPRRHPPCHFWPFLWFICSIFPSPSPSW